MLMMFFKKSDTDALKMATKHVHFGTITCIQHIKQFVWSTSSDHAIVLWEPETYLALMELKEHNDIISWITPLGEQMLWSAAMDGTVSVYVDNRYPAIEEIAPAPVSKRASYRESLYHAPTSPKRDPNLKAQMRRSLSIGGAFSRLMRSKDKV
jgi:uncharacterized protein with von Willebrand factor type A (vWA) domain